VTDPVEDAVAFDLFLEGSSSEIAAIARALRLTVLEALPDAIEWFDPGDGLLAFGSRRAMRDLYFAIIPHKAHVNLQLVDGVDLPNPDGRIEGTGKRARHVKIRSLEDVGSTWARAAIRAQIEFRSGAPSDPGA
jgi:Domain of unknown function (DU1801)